MTLTHITAVMRPEFPLLQTDTSIRSAAAALVKARTAAAPVVGEDGRLVGLLTQKDCFRSALHASYYREWTGRVEDHMSRDIITLHPQDDLIRAAEMFLLHPHRVFPVCDAGTVLGMVHRSDVLSELIRLG